MCLCSTTIQSFLPAEMAALSSAPSKSPQSSRLPTELINSISKDIDGVRDISAGLDHAAVGEFLTVLEQCEGQILLSGIGEKKFLLFSDSCPCDHSAG